MKSKKTRIVKRTLPSGRVTYSIQQPHFLFRWWWVEAWVNSGVEGTTSSFDTIEEAKENLCWFDGTIVVEDVVY